MPFEKVANFSDIPEGKMYAVIRGYATIAVAKVEGKVYAFDAWCTHGGWLVTGALEGHEAICQVHWGSFDVRTGKAVGWPCRVPLNTYPIRVASGDVEIDLPPGFPGRPPENTEEVNGDPPEIPDEPWENPA